MPRPLVIPTAVLLSLLPSGSVAADRPMTGKQEARFAGIDKAILRYMDRVNCRAATVAVSSNGKLLYSRGYGWSDQARKKPTPPDALMRIASVTKPLTAAAVKNLVRAGKLSLQAKAFDLIAVKPPGGKVADPRIKNITVAHLLDHQGGWEWNPASDPMFHTREIEKALRLRRPAAPTDVVRYMLGRPLQFAPGEKTAYSNFGYCVLGRVLEKVVKKPYEQCIQQVVCRPAGVKDVKLGSAYPGKRDAREVWYPREAYRFSLAVMDAHGGLIASAPGLCRFLEAHWINGDLRQAGRPGEFTAFGSLPGTTAMVRQRDDGINVAVLLNGRRDKHVNEDTEALKRAIDAAIDKAGK
jgi:CubicO group peptidase (beta-lactamase class C family)